VARSDAAGATHGFVAACRDRAVGFSIGHPITDSIRAAISALPAAAWAVAVEADGTVRDGAMLAEIPGLIDLSTWPTGARLVVRKERPHPGAALSLFDTLEGMRHNAFRTDTAAGDVAGQIGGLELRHRQHARIEDRIRQAKAAGLRNLPCRAAPENHAWFEVVLAGMDLVAWSKLICFAEHPALARCEIDTYRYRILHVAARLTRCCRSVGSISLTV
jgi:hypothetical protein